MDGVRDQAVSQWGNVYVAGDPNHPPRRHDRTTIRAIASRSARPTISSSGGASAHRLDLTTAASRAGLTRCSGASPGVNGDNQTLNDNLFLPQADSSADVHERHLRSAARLPRQARVHGESDRPDHGAQLAAARRGSNTLDARFAVKLPFRKVKAEITLDILNMINLVDSASGLFRYANFNDILPVDARADRRRDDRDEPGDVEQPELHRVHAQRPALALADAARRAHPVLAAETRSRTHTPGLPVPHALRLTCRSARGRAVRFCLCLRRRRKGNWRRRRGR